MQGKLEREGKYEIFETTHNHQILVLNNRHYFAIVKGKYGDILIASDSDHKKKKSIKSGIFYLADFDDDPEFRDLPHLFLEEGDKFRVWILPNNMPAENDYQKKLVKSDELVSKEKVQYHVKGSGEKGTEKQYKNTPKEASSNEEAISDLNNPPEDRKVIQSRNIGEKSKTELYQEARKAGIEGRSQMSKEELESVIKERKR